MPKEKNSMELKIPPLLLVVIAAALMWALSLVTPAFMISVPGASVLAVLLAVVGAAVISMGGLVFRRAKTTVDPLNPDRASALVVDGIYRYTRNPMYVGFAMLLVAWAVYLTNVAALLVVVLFVAYIDRFQIVPEERALSSAFGEAYAAYKASVRRWL
jgi:protein-S-isoprenylcysteine O-methyltransferase Ste14